MLWLLAAVEMILPGLPETLPSFYMVILKGEFTPFTLEYVDCGFDLSCSGGVLPCRWDGGKGE